MLSYRHGYHAANIADVLKHATLLASLDWMQRKEKPFRFIDTHAGAGHYRLDHPFAQKTKEADDGFLKLDALPASGAPAAIKRLRTAVERYAISFPGHYPGSPALAATELRAIDRGDFYELHPSDFETLDGYLGGLRRNVDAHHSDGFEGLLSCLPAVQKRALVLIDPSYEMDSDFTRLPKVIREVKARQNNAVVLIWYPVIYRNQSDNLLKSIRNAWQGSNFHFELQSAPDSSARGMTANGMLVLNPTYGLYPALESLGQYLADNNMVIGFQGEDHTE
ncbi:MAG: 23S rRNA (adenine(2030)-N(6))-methyltransferase RlmJ [Gammaproteobacteria bacterium]|nr:23S rRNA (adenine(2030)-N(6))-methyltransferase RlmJ [Gammaproteobacteria bacterium]